MSELDDYMGCLDDQLGVCETGTCGSEAIRHSTCMLSCCVEHGVVAVRMNERPAPGN
ncbi:hypothetical protein [Sorangium sp. So ce861]|uniref:hypothetical protein n=1 Tax=Sorangium sp. So ce861 TaxID=3133323 RepID=UPI003F623686